MALPPKAFDTLLILVQNHGHALKKDDLIKQVWPDAFVEESNLNHNISVIRKALNGGQNGDGFIETVRGYGFRFNANVRARVEAAELVVQKRTSTHVVIKEQTSETLKTGMTTTITETRVSPWRVSVLAAFVILVVGASIVGYLRFVRAAYSHNSNLPSAVAAPRHKVSENPAAREAYLKGRYFLNKRTFESVRDAQSEFQAALEIDPSFAPAYAGLADCFLLGGWTPGTGETPETLALRALELDDNLAEAHASLAYFKGAVKWDWLGAEVEFQRAVSLDPAYPTAHHWHAYNLASLGRLDDALAEIKKAQQLDPLSLIIKTDVGHILYLSHRYDEAISQYLKVLEMDGDFRVAHWRLGESYAQKRKFEDARVEFEKVLALDDEKHSMQAWLAYSEAVANHRDAALKICHKLEQNAEIRMNTFEIALISTGLGDRDSAFSWLDKAIKNHEGQLALIKVEPMLDSLRDDSRFTDLLKRMGLD